MSSLSTVYGKAIRKADEFNRNSHLNEQIDNNEEVELIIRKGEEEHIINNISEALFHGDPEEYSQQIMEAKNNFRKKSLRLDEYEDNENNYEKLFNSIKQRAIVIPFIGAGFSVPAGCPSWSKYIIDQATKARFPEEETQNRILSGEHEMVMTEVINRLSLNKFKRDFKSSFQNSNITAALSPCTELDELFEQCVITTNFDRVLEDSVTQSFVEKSVGAETSGRFIRAIFSGDRYLLKLHGNIDEDQDRVLTKEEYDMAYGHSEIDWSLPVPRKLKKIFENYSVLFLGCSLIGDRYLDILREVRTAQADFMPDHFAILTSPDDDEERIARDRFLAELGITPIWFSHGDWNAPPEILRLLKIELNN
ncbi:SIR2 family protein [Chromohalobacter canadensis]|uniref:SIR2 family protein n=1 Tax=Chromohalobacter canadensis TaxID=141389 RepID=UPI0021C0EC6E|nr:SIR2 family protein [Chromohalobacter canadensis]MCT8467535.1 SIR2 family protein [Chromohalobacter canadensis]MCT8470717.1 SIR2 family protein [Chromohalobacter canadensis]MCT8498032.1 SIR2 family protein [Chromohalobacter canadensis]